MHPVEVWHGKGIGARLLRSLLYPLSLLYALGWNLYASVYRLGLKKAKAPHRPVVCIGNLKVGGSGKTPVALHVAKVLRGMGHEVVLGVSGYGAPRSQDATLAPEGPLNAKEWGDEPAMARWLRPELPLIVGRNRVRAAEICHEQFPNAVMVMDDGFQHLPLNKDLTIVLDDPAESNHFCLPAGPYREPKSGLKRADMAIPGECRIEGGLAGFRDPTGSTVNPEQGMKVDLLCALGNPAAFKSAVERFGLAVREAAFLPDHDPLDAGTLLSRFDSHLPVVVTAKDWVKLRERADLEGRTFWIADHDLHVEPADAFREWLRTHLETVAQKA